MFLYFHFSIVPVRVFVCVCVGFPVCVPVRVPIEVYVYIYVSVFDPAGVRIDMVVYYLFMLSCVLWFGVKSEFWEFSWRKGCSPCPW